MRKPWILVVQNAEWEGPGLVGVEAEAEGIEMTVSKLLKGGRGSLPLEKLEKGGFSAVVALGSPATAYMPETNPRHDELVELFKLVRRRKIPSFNICYSMQLFSLVHGGKVGKNPAGKEVGFFDVQPTGRGKSDPVIGPIGSFLSLQWHGDIVERLPPGAVHLASSGKTEHQVAKLDGIHYLVQADGQAATSSMLETWLENDGDWATDGTGLRPAELLQVARWRAPYLRETFHHVFGNFLALALKNQPDA